MLKILVAFALGPWGMKLMYFYEQNSAIINSIVVAYGVFLVLSHYNFTKILNHLEEQFNGQKGKKSKKNIQIDINKGIDESKTFPFVSGQLSLIARKTNKENVLRYLKKEKRWGDLTKGNEVNFL